MYHVTLNKDDVKAELVKVLHGSAFAPKTDELWKFSFVGELFYLCFQIRHILLNHNTLKWPQGRLCDTFNAFKTSVVPPGSYS